MVSSLLLGTVLLSPAAPVPLDTIPMPTGPAPQIAFLKAEANGEVHVNGYTVQKQKYMQSMVVVENGKQVVKQVEREQLVPMNFRRQLSDAGTKFSLADGTELSAAAAAKRIGDGAVVLVSSDGKPLEKAWLRCVHPDTVVIVSDALAGAVILPPAPALPTTPAPRLVLLAADATGKVSITYNPGGSNDNSYEQIRAARVMIVNGQVIRGGFDPTPGPGPNGEYPSRPLDDIKFEAYELDGQSIPREVALDRLKAGGLVVVAGDGRLPDAAFLKLFRGDLLVLVSPELALPASAHARIINPGVRRVVPANNAVPPAPAPIPVQIQPGVVPAGNLKLAPANPPIQRAVPAQPQAQPRPAPAEKPAVEKPAPIEK